MAYAFMSIEKIKNLAAFNGKMGHNYRLVNVVNADKNLVSLNEELIPLKASNYLEGYKEKIKESEYYKERAVRKDNVRGLEIMMTHSKDVGDAFDLEGWKDGNIDWIEKSFGKDNVLSMVYHGDEATNHIHAVVIPMVEGRLSSVSYIGNRGKLIALQDSYGKSMEPFGLKRGLKHSVAKHTDIRKFYDSLNKEIAKELPLPKEKETTTEYRKRANEVYEQSNLKNLKSIHDMERKIIEEKTYQKQNYIALSKENKELNLTIHGLKNRESEEKELIREYSGLESVKEILNSSKAVKEKQKEFLQDFPDKHKEIEEMNHIMRTTMNDMIKWNDKKIKEKEREENVPER